MTTNNPAHDPVSLDRLHQIREILSKASAQSDGGNLGYAMADAVKVIDGAIAAFDAEPVAWKSVFRLTGQTGSDFEKIFENREAMDAVVSLHERGGFNVTVTPLYTVPPAPVVQCPFPCGWDNLNKLAIQDAAFAARGLVEGEEVTEAYRQAVIANNDRLMKVISACRSAVLQAGNSPVTPDGWVDCSERMSEKYDFDIWVFSPSRGVRDGLQWDGSMFADDEYQFVIHDATHWMRKAYPAAPQQEVKS
ncbi:MAG: DUF551 domain-containing protein [Hafnia sp.]